MMNFKHHKFIWIGSVLVLACIGVWAFCIAGLPRFTPVRIPTLIVERDGENIVVRAYPDIHETHLGVNRALEAAGIPCDTVCIVSIGKKRAAVLSMRDWSFWEKRQKEPRFWGGSDPGPLLLVPVDAILEAFDVLGQPTNSISSSMVDLRAPLGQRKKE